MRSTRATIEKVGQLAKTFQAVLDLADDNADLDALERQEQALTRNISTKKEELTGLDARIQTVKDAETARAASDKEAEKKRDTVLENARAARDDMLAHARADAEQIIGEAKKEGERITALHKKTHTSLIENIQSARDELRDVNTEITAARATHEELKGHIATANATIADLIKRTTVGTK